MSNQIKTILWAALALGIFLIGSALRSHWIDEGKQDVQTLWDADKIAQNKATAELKEKYDTLQTTHQTDSARFSTELADAKKTHAVAVSDIKRDYDNRMRSSETRAGIYQRQAEAGTIECRSLASHAARLDSNLEEGRSLVRELQATIRLRDEQLISLGHQITADRNLITGQ